MMYTKANRVKNATAVIAKKAGIVMFYSITTFPDSLSSACTLPHSAKNAISVLNTEKPKMNAIVAI